MDSNTRQAIAGIVNSDFDVVEIEEHDGNNTYVVAYKFQESYADHANSIQYNTVFGVDITDFLKKNLNNMIINKKEFTSTLLTFLEDAPSIRIQFSVVVKWKKYSKN